MKIKMTIPEAIDCVTKTLKSGVAIHWIQLALKDDGFSPKQIESIIAWARQNIHKGV